MQKWDIEKKINMEEGEKTLRKSSSFSKIHLEELFPLPNEEAEEEDKEEGPQVDVTFAPRIPHSNIGSISRRRRCLS